jgi:hypothetical protein
MKTLIVYELVPEQTKFFLVDEDASRLNGCFENTVGCEKKFSKAVRDEVSLGAWGNEVQLPLTLTDTIVVHCGFML